MDLYRLPEAKVQALLQVAGAVTEHYGIGDRLDAWAGRIPVQEAFSSAILRAPGITEPLAAQGAGRRGRVSRGLVAVPVPGADRVGQPRRAADRRAVAHVSPINFHEQMGTMYRSCARSSKGSASTSRRPTRRARSWPSKAPTRSTSRRRRETDAARRVDNNNNGSENGMDIKVGKQAIDEAHRKLSNWGRWGPDDQIGTLNLVTPEDIIAAAKLIRKGKTFALGLPLDRTDPQNGLFGGRWNPIHTMLATGTDAVAGQPGRGPEPALRRRRHRHAVPGRDPVGRARPHLLRRQDVQRLRRASWSTAAARTSSASSTASDKMVGRGVLLDVARYKGVDCLDGRLRRSPTTSSTRPREAQGVEIAARRLRHRPHRPHGALPRARRLGRLRRRRRAGPRVRDLLLDASEKEIAGDLLRHLGLSRCGRTRPTRRTSPGTGWSSRRSALTMGEIFYLKDLAEDCAADGVYEFFFCAPPLNITGGTGSPINPQAIK